MRSGTPSWVPYKRLFKIRQISDYAPHFVRVAHAREDVDDLRSHDFGVRLPGAGLEEDEAFGGMFDEDADHDELAAFGDPVGVGRGRGAGLEVCCENVLRLSL